MKTATIVLAALSVYFLGIAMLVSAGAAAPATGPDRCKLCHTAAHPDGWARITHGSALSSGAIPTEECTRCHATSECTGCHELTKTMQAPIESEPQIPQPSTQQ